MRAIAAAIGFALMTSCGAPKDKLPGNGLAAPTSIRAVPGSRDFFVLSSGAFGDYARGSLQRYSLVDGKKAVIKSALDVPLLGSALALSGDGQWIASGFVGKNSRISLYKSSGSGNPISVFDISLPAVSTLSDLRFFNFEGVEYLSVSLNAQSDRSQILVWKLSNSAPARVLQLPDDLKSSYTLSFAHPTFLSSAGLLLVFPAHKEFPDGSHADPISFQQGARSRASEDPRVVSALAIDLGRLSASGGSLDKSYVAVPLIFDGYGNPGNLALPAWRPENSAVQYRSFVQAAVHPSSTACASGYGDSVLVADGAGVFRLSGWTALKSGFAAVFEESDFTKKAVVGGVTAALYSSFSATRNLSNFETRFLGFVEDAGESSCFPAWTRMEVRSSGQSNARSWLVGNEGRDPFSPFSKQFPSRGVADAFVRDGAALGISFSYGVMDILTLP